MVRNLKAQTLEHLLFQSVQKIRLQGIHLPALGTDGMVMAVARSRLFSVQLIPGETVVKGDLFDHMQFQKDLYGPVYGCKPDLRAFLFCQVIDLLHRQVLVPVGAQDI